MEKHFNKDELETIVLQTIYTRPHQEINSCRIYWVQKEGEELVVKNLKGNKEVSDLQELEDAINNSAIDNIFIPKYASITSKGIKKVLERTSLAKDIYTAFEVKE